jgi:hypothetical protein
MTDFAAGNSVTIEALYADDDQHVSDFYRCVLAPHFRADELESEEDFAAGLHEGSTRALAARMRDGKIAGGWSASGTREARFCCCPT